MSDTETPPSELAARLDRFEERLATVERKLDFLGNNCGQMFDAEDQLRHGINNEITDIYERLENIELTLFPKLPKAIRRLRKVIGKHDSPAHNPLDRRERLPRR